MKLSLLLSFFSIGLVFSQEISLKSDDEKFGREFVKMIFGKANYHNSVGVEKLEWIFEFSHKDSVTLSVMLNHYVRAHQNVYLDTIRVGTISDKKLFGLYLADLIDSTLHTKDDLLSKIKQHQKSFKRSEITLSGVGFNFQKGQKPENSIGQDRLTIDDHIRSLEGKVVDSKTGQALPYASIGIENSNIGTVSDVNGRFNLSIASEHFQDSISFSFVGYHKIKKEVHSFVNIESATIHMEESTYKLDEVVIDSKRFNKKKVFGITKVGNQFGFVQGTGAGAEAARLINPNSNTIYLNKAAIYVWNKKGVPFKFTINIYDVDPLTGLPANNLLKKPLLIESSVSKGWLEFDLNHQNLVLQQPFFVSFQWLDENLKHPSIGLKGTRAFIRPVSFGDWIETSDFSWAIKVEATILDK